MTKQLIALAIAATFGIAHAADVKPAVADLKAAAPAAAPAPAAAAAAATMAASAATEAKQVTADSAVAPASTASQ